MRKFGITIFSLLTLAVSAAQAQQDQGSAPAPAPAPAPSAQQADGSVGQQTRPNPFKAPPSAQEQELIENERLRNVVRAMEGEFVNKVGQRFDDKMGQMEKDLKTAIEASIANQVAAQPKISGAPGIGQIVADSVAKATGEKPVPDGSKFISCVNNKALYRDNNNFLFQDKTPTNVCAH